MVVEEALEIATSQQLIDELTNRPTFQGAIVYLETQNHPNAMIAMQKTRLEKGNISDLFAMILLQGGVYHIQEQIQKNHGKG